jgi:hypothetical protein
MTIQKTYSDGDRRLTVQEDLERQEVTVSISEDPGDNLASVTLPKAEWWMLIGHVYGESLAYKQKKESEERPRRMKANVAWSSYRPEDVRTIHSVEHDELTDPSHGLNICSNRGCSPR